MSDHCEAIICGTDPNKRTCLPTSVIGHTMIKHLSLFILLLTVNASLNSLYAVNVNSSNQLLSELSKAKPGDVIIVKPGTYKGLKAISANGKPDNPITVKAESIGKCMLVDQLLIKGAHIHLEGFSFTGKGSILVEGRNCRITRCTMSNVESGKWIWIAAGSQEIEIDHCLFENKDINKKLPKGCQLLQANVLNKNEKHHFHHNHFRNIPKGLNSNGYETVQLITNGNPRVPPGDRTGNIVEYNLFEQCDGEAEIISVKSNGNILRHNTFRDCRGQLVLRHGKENIVDGNYFLWSTTPQVGGVRLQGTGQVIVNNYFYNISSAITFMDGTPDDLYVRVEKAQIMHNTIIDCGQGMTIGINHSKYPNQAGFEPKDCVVKNNIFQIPSGKVINYINNDVPTNWTWENNIYSGNIGINPIKGLDSDDAFLTASDKIIYLPTAKTPAANPAFETDLLKVKRMKKSKLGAFEYPHDINNKRPLTVSDVGPRSK